MKFQYKLYQVQKDKTRDFGFMGLEMLKRLYVKLDAANYVKTYEGEVEAKGTYDACNTIYRKFNIDRPADFTHYSMSMGDIIVIDDVNYYTDSIGFVEVDINFAECV